MNSLKCIVIDDEPFALDLIKGYVEKTPFLEYTNGFTNPLRALQFLQDNNVDLVFLDINMPELTGLQLLNSLNNPPSIIFTTAYSEFAAESYDYNTVDYLLKPIKYDRFLKAVSKIAQPRSLIDTEETPETVYIKSGTQINQITVKSIKYIEGAGNYMTFYIDTRKIMSLMSMKEVLDLLTSRNFARIHKSYIVSLDHIDIIEKHQVIISGDKIPIGVTYREEFLKRFENKA